MISKSNIVISVQFNVAASIAFNQLLTPNLLTQKKIITVCQKTGKKPYYMIKK